MAFRLPQPGSPGDNAPNRRRSTKARAARCLLILAGPGLAALAGCGKSDVIYEVVPVAGKITFDGKPPQGAVVMLTPVSPPEDDAVAPQGGVQADGSYKITSYTSGDGAPPGEYVVTVSWYKMDEKLGGPGPNVVPAEFTDPAKSKLKVTINQGAPTEIPPIDIKSKSEKSKS